MSCDREHVIFIIKEHTFDILLPRYCSANKRYFEEQSYLLWGVNELISRIREQKTRFPLEIIQEFARQMRMFAKSKNLFSPIYKMADDILEIIRTV